MWQVGTDCYLIALASDEERDVGDIRERVFIRHVLSTLHFSIKVLEVLSKLRPGLFDLVAVGYITCRALHAGVAVVDPDSDARASQRVLWHQRHAGILFFEILIDDSGLVNNRIAVHQHRNLAIGIQSEKVFGLVAEIAFYQLEGNLFFRQDNPCPVSVRSGTVREELHGSHLQYVMPCTT